jgi:transcriptional regulator, DeoR family
VQNIEAKKRIAQRAFGLIKDAKVIFLDAGTTNRELALLLKDREGLSVVTTDLMVAGVLQSGKGRIFFCGGEIQKSTGSALGSYTVNQLKDYSFDIAFLGASSINDRMELSTPTLEKVALKKAILQQTKRAVLLADASKFEKQAMMKICSIQEFDTLVTDKAFSERERKELEKRGVEIIGRAE